VALDPQLPLAQAASWSLTLLNGWFCNEINRTPGRGGSIFGANLDPEPTKKQENGPVTRGSLGGNTCATRY
jgi:hypothetical protein